MSSAGSSSSSGINMMRTIRTLLFQNVCKVALLGTMSIALVSCGGDDKGSRVLHFTGRDETEANYRDRVRQLTRLPGVKTELCLPLVGKTPEQAHALLTDVDDFDPTDIPAGATPRPGQKATRADLIRSAEIVLEECKR